MFDGWLDSHELMMDAGRWTLDGLDGWRLAGGQGCHLTEAMGFHVTDEEPPKGRVSASSVMVGAYPANVEALDKGSGLA